MPCNLLEHILLSQPTNEHVQMTTPSSVVVSRLWSAKGDDRCSPPRSDDYKHWSLMQLKREITQRQLKTNPRRRNKDAFVRVLLQNDQEEPKTQAPSSRQALTLSQQETLDEPVRIVPTATSELEKSYVKSGDHEQDIHGTNGGRHPQQQQELYLDQPQQPQEPEHKGEQPHPQQQALTNSGVMQTARLTLPAAQTLTQSSKVPVAATGTLALESEVERVVQATKRQRVERGGHESEGSEKVNSAAAPEMNRTECTGRQSEKGGTEYLRRKLSVQAARLEIESRRLELETKREQRESEVHAVQLALAQEQLQQAKITTQKMKTEWMVEQLVQKKRLNDAGISQNDSTTLGMYLS